MNLIEHFIDGKITKGSSKKKSKVFNPATGEQTAEVKLASKSDVDLAVEKAKKNLITVYRNGTTINHEVYATYLSSRVMIRPASSGTGVIAGAAVRSVLELAGIKDVLTKSLGSRNPINVVTATVKCLEQLTDPDDKAGQLGKTASDLDLPKQFYKNKSEGEASA